MKKIVKIKESELVSLIEKIISETVKKKNINEDIQSGKRTIKVKSYYETISPESAEHGDFEDSGDHEEQEFDSLSEVGRYLKRKGVEFINSYSGNGFRTVDPDRNYSTGEETYYSYFVSGLSDREMKALIKFVTK